MDKLIFDEEKQFVDYQTRYAAHIITERDQQVAIIEAPNGTFFLPGGEIEEEETKEEAIVRELIEEMGIVAKVSSYPGEANEYFYSNYRTTYYYNPGYFFVADSWKRIGESTEKTDKVR